MLVEYRYIDIIWLDNMIMNLILLWTTSKISKDQTKLWRLCISSCIGATYAVFLIVTKHVILDSWGIKILLSFLMILIGFKFKALSRLFRQIGVFYGVTFAFGGAAFGLYYFTYDIISIEEGIFYFKNFPVKVLIMSSFLLVILICTIGPKLYRKFISANLIYNIQIKYNGCDIILDAFLDTGNSLRDPMTQSPVIIVEYTKIQQALPKGIKDIYSPSMELDMDSIVKTLAGTEFQERFRLIPYYAVGKQGGLLLGFKPDKVLIFVQDRWQENEDIVIALYNHKLSKEDDYQALLNPDILSA